MAYEPKEWVCGETITADGLNNLEEGVQEALNGNDIFAVHVDVDFQATPSGTPYQTTADKTFAEIKEAYEAGKIIKMYVVDDGGAYVWECNTGVYKVNGEPMGFSGQIMNVEEMSQPIQSIQFIAIFVSSAMGATYIITSRTFN